MMAAPMTHRRTGHARERCFTDASIAAGRIYPPG